MNFIGKSSGKLIRNKEELLLIRKINENVTMVPGAFDLPHIGHRRFLEKAGDIARKTDQIQEGVRSLLILLLSSDEFIEERKGKKPVRNEKTRIRRMKRNKHLDHIFIINNVEEFYEIIDLFSPDTLVLSHTTNDTQTNAETMTKLFRDTIKEIIILEAQSSIHSSDIRRRKNL